MLLAQSPMGTKRYSVCLTNEGIGTLLGRRLQKRLKRCPVRRSLCSFVIGVGQFMSVHA